MNIQSHYNLSFLIGLEAGFLPHQASLLARTNAMVDWATPDHISGPYHAQNLPLPCITQVYDYRMLGKVSDTDPRTIIWRSFHFPVKTNITMPGLVVAGEVPYFVFSKVSSQTIIQSGISLHAFGDTFTHDGFSAYRGPWNNRKVDGSFWDKIEGWILSNAPAIGHAEYGGLPDGVNGEWINQDGVKVRNKSRFINYILMLQDRIGKTLPLSLESILQAKDDKHLAKLANSFATRQFDIDPTEQVFVPFSPNSVEWSMFCSMSREMI